MYPTILSGRKDSGPVIPPIIPGDGDVLLDVVLASPGDFILDNINQGYEHLLIYASVKTSKNVNTQALDLILNDDAVDANYRFQYRQMLKAGSSRNHGDLPQVVINVPASEDTSPAGMFGFLEILISWYSSNEGKTIHCKMFTGDYITTTTNALWSYNALAWENTNPITKIALQPDDYPTSNFVANSSIQIIGLKV